MATLDAPRDGSRTPTVYLYHVPAIEAFAHSATDYALDTWAFGPEITGATDLYATDEFALPLIVLHRVFRGGVRRTLRPEEADLFLAPLLMDGPPLRSLTAEEEALRAAGDLGHHAKQPPLHELLMRPVCDQIYRRNLSEVFPHLTLETASRHLLLVYKNIGFCSMMAGYTDDAPPPSAALLDRMQYIAHEVFHTTEPPSHLGLMPFPGSVGRGAALVTNVPFAASISSLGVLRRMYSTQRRYLMSFGGSLEGRADLRTPQLRRTLWEACERYGAPDCARLTSTGGQSFSFQLAAAFELKRASTSCLEPGGFSVIRKAVLDGLLLGCIPVARLLR